jgi:signal transduction histidine kinase
VLQLLGLGVFLGSIKAIPAWSRRVPPRLLAFVAAAAPCLLLLVFSIDALSNTERVNLVAYTVIILGTAILLPWGIWAQVALTGFVVVSIISGALVGGGRLPDPATIPAIAVAIGLSYFVALVLERNRLTLARQRRELAAERELAEARRINAEALAHDLDAYAHTVAHDLKNPVGVIYGYNDLLQIELAETASENAHELLEATGRAA